MGQDVRPDEAGAEAGADAGADVLDAGALEEVSGGCATASDAFAVGIERRAGDWLRD